MSDPADEGSKLHNPIRVVVASLLFVGSIAGVAHADEQAAHDPPAFATPRDLLGKSIQDLKRGRLEAAARDDIKALRRGPLLIHGNYCGIGNRPGAPPIDELDSACMRHDACTHDGRLPSCRCDERLRVEATEIAKDGSVRPDVRAIAAAAAAGMAVLICR